MPLLGGPVSTINHSNAGATNEKEKIKKWRKTLYDGCFQLLLLSISRNTRTLSQKVHWAENVGDYN